MDDDGADGAMPPMDEVGIAPPAERGGVGTDDEDDEGEYEYEEYSESELAMDPDSDLMARPQRALKAQLLAQRERVLETLRERLENLRVTVAQRERLGQELYATQQQLAKMQLSMEKCQDNFTTVNKSRVASEAELTRVKQEVTAHEELVAAEKKKADTIQLELEKLSQTVRQIELYNTQMKDEIAVTRRATYAAEENISKREKEKSEQDALLDKLHEELKTLKRKYELHSAQLEAQQGETIAAKEMLTEAEERMQDINFQKKQLVQQWKSTLIGMARRDEALQATEDALRKQREQGIAIDQELEGYRKSIRDEEAKNEKLTLFFNSLGNEIDIVKRAIGSHKERHEELLETFGKLKRSLESTEERRVQAVTEGKELEQELNMLENEIVKTNRSIQNISDEMLTKLSEQTTAEKAAQKTAIGTKELKVKVRQQEMRGVQLQNDLAKLNVDILNTEGHNEKLVETSTSLNDELTAKGATIEKYELEIRRRNDEIEKKTKEVDRLNRQYDRLTSNVEDENLGPLEATIANISREIGTKVHESKELQRQWIVIQMELVTLQNENNALAERIQRLKSEKTVYTEKRKRLEQKLEQQQRFIKGLNSAISKMHTEMTRLNQLISKNSELQAELANDNFNLESGISNNLKEMEIESNALDSKISDLQTEKKELLAEIIETERQIQLWERKIQLERETQEALDPTVGTDVVGAMKKEIHRMKLRHKELLRKQEILIKEMERAITKRDMIATKGIAQQAKKQPELTESQLVKACKDLERSIADTTKESKRSTVRIKELERERDATGEELTRIGDAITELKTREEEVKARINVLSRDRTRVVVEKSSVQHMIRRMEEYVGGKRQINANSTIEGALSDLKRAKEKNAAVVDLLTELFSVNPQLEADSTRAVALQMLLQGQRQRQQQ